MPPPVPILAGADNDESRNCMFFRISPNLHANIVSDSRVAGIFFILEGFFADHAGQACRADRMGDAGNNIVPWLARFAAHHFSTPSALNEYLQLTLSYSESIRLLF